MRKGIGPRGLGASPFKQTDHARLAEIKETRNNLNKKFVPVEERRLQAEVKELNSSYKPQDQMQGSAGIFSFIGGPVSKGLTSLATKLFGTSRTASRNQKAWEAFKKASPKDPSKTTRLSNYANNSSSNLRQNSTGGTTSVSSRPNYNNRGSN